MISPNDLSKGKFIKLGNELFVVLDFQHIKPGKGGAFVRTKLKNIKTGAVIDRTFREIEQIEDVFIEEKRLLYLYQSGQSYHFMDQQTYDEVVLDRDRLGETVHYLNDNLEVIASVYDGEVVLVSAPIFVDLKVVMTEPGFKGDTAKGGTKPARLETGLNIQVPLFVNIGDVVRVDTRTGEYVGRV